MELFVMNRVDDNQQVSQEEEQLRIQNILRQIEQKKSARKQQKQTNKTGETNQQNDSDKLDHNNIVEGPSLESEPATKPKRARRKRKIDEVNVEGFTVLGAESLAKKAKVKRVLPKWLSNPTIISSDLHELTAKVSRFKQLDKALRKRLRANGIKYLFPVQAQLVPYLLDVNRHVDIVFPRDLCVSAPTGSGKTLAFVLPVVQILQRHSVRKIRALIILPTQDLADQVFKTFKLYSQGSNLETCLVTGKNSFEQEQKQLINPSEVFGYISKADILVCTPGRLVNHLKSTEGLDLRFLEFLIIDEADRVLDSVQNDWLYHLEKHIQEDFQSTKILNLINLRKKRPPQKLLFSATLTQDPEKLEKLSLFQPKLFTCITDSVDDGEELPAESFIGKYTTPKELTEKYVTTQESLKPLALYKLIEQQELTKTIVFTHSIESTHRLKLLLNLLFEETKKIEEIASTLKAKNRDKLIESFSKGEIDILICTDALARGIDLPQVKCVISYSAPKFLRTYIHRSGRTARAGEKGTAITLLHQEQVAQFKTLLKQSKKENVEELVVPEKDLEPLSGKYRKALNKLKTSVTKEHKQGLKKTVAKKRSVRKEKKVGNS